MDYSAALIFKSNGQLSLGVMTGAITLNSVNYGTVISEIGDGFDVQKADASTL